MRYIIPVLMVAGIIFYLSDQPNLGRGFSNPLENILRKGAHFLEYGLLTFFLWRLFYRGWKFFPGATLIVVLFLIIFYAGLDEFHQSFVEGRHGSAVDVVIDFLSAFVVLQIILIFLKRKAKKAVAVNIWLAILGGLIFSGIVGTLVWQSYEGDKVKRENDFRQAMKHKSLKVIPADDLKLDTENGAENIQSGDVKKVISKKPLVQNEDNNKPLPRKVKHKVAFITQSPFAKWDELHEEVCEEASLIMLKYYDSGEKLDKNIAEDEIQKLVKYQIEKYGDFYDTDVKTNKEIGGEYFRLDNLKIIENFTILDLKKELVEGGIILIPTAGRELKNPYFSGAGPLYHNLVIIGYNDKKNTFITNDPGTRRGKNYEYNQELLYKAIHDFPGDINKILQGSKRAIVLEEFPISKIQDTNKLQ